MRFAIPARVVALLASTQLCMAASATSGVSDRIEGVWVVDHAEHELAPYPELEGATVTFTGDHFRIERIGRTAWYGTFKADYAKGTIDLIHEARLMLPPVAGERWEGIFRWDQDELQMCHAEAHDARPTEFLSGYDLTCMKLHHR